MINTLKYQGLTILWALFIFVLCTIKLGSVSESPLFFPGFDKLVHCGFFFVFVVFYDGGLIRQHKGIPISYTYAFMVLFIAILYGFTIEVLQKYVFTWREFEWNDLISDTIGASMGTFSVLVINRASNVKK